MRVVRNALKDFEEFQYWTGFFQRAEFRVYVYVVPVVQRTLTKGALRGEIIPLHAGFDQHPELEHGVGGGFGPWIVGHSHDAVLTLAEALNNTDHDFSRSKNAVTATAMMYAMTNTVKVFILPPEFEILLIPRLRHVRRDQDQHAPVDCLRRR